MDIKTFLKQEEGQVLTCYQDGAGLCTVGIGHKVTPQDNIQLGDTITQDQCDAFLEQDIQTASQAVDTIVTVPISNNARTALISLSFNIGINNLRSSTLISMLNAGYMQGAADQFLRWDKMHVNGQIVESQGLLNRRNAERDLFLTPDDQ